MRYALIAILLCAIFGLLYEVRGFSMERQSHEADLKILNARLGALQMENKKLQTDIEYYSDEANLLKEARSELPYRSPDEKMLIVVPKKTP
jgi:cell division protein FtsB